MDKRTAPIGVFDSGIGGLTVASALAKALPEESIIYFGDTAHLPYGEKSAASILSYAEGIADFLIEQGCKMLVIACNSASAVAYEALRIKLKGQVPVVDVITPLIDLVAKEAFHKVGVIATKATVRSDIYPMQLHRSKPDMEVVSLATGMLAAMIEEGFVNNEISQVVLHQYLTYPDFEDIDALLLACTHYPLIRPEIEAFYQGRVAVYDSVDAVLKKVVQILDTFELRNLSSTRGVHHFYVSEYTHSFEKATAIFYQQELRLEVASWVNGKLYLG
jgi:glutamate racemase